MTPKEIQKWRKVILGRLDVLKTKARHAHQYLEANDLDRFPDTEELQQAWNRVQELFPDDFNPLRAGDLSRHIGFSEACDFRDIENIDVPAIEAAVDRYGRRGNDFIGHELAGLEFDLEAWELLHPQIQDACKDLFDDGQYRDAARTSVELIMGEIRRLTGRHDDGDKFIRHTVGVDRQLAFSANTTDSERSITKGLTQILQGLYAGVRNPTSHGFGGFSRLETFQIMSMCSFLLGRLQLIGSEVG